MPDGQVWRLPAQDLSQPRLRADRVHHGEGRPKRSDGAEPRPEPAQAGQRPRRHGRPQPRPARCPGRQEPPMRQNRRPKVYYATQVGTNPPTIVLFTNGPELFDHTYQRYLVKRSAISCPSTRCRSSSISAAQSRGKRTARRYGNPHAARAGEDPDCLDEDPGCRHENSDRGGKEETEEQGTGVVERPLSNAGPGGSQNFAGEAWPQASRPISDWGSCRCLCCSPSRHRG